MGTLNQAECGAPVADLCRKHGVNTASFYKWRANYGGIEASLISRMKALDEENKRLKKMFAEKSMQNDLLKEALGKKYQGRLNAKRWPNELCDTNPSAFGLRAGRSASAKPAIGISQS